MMMRSREEIREKIYIKKTNIIYKIDSRITSYKTHKNKEMILMLYCYIHINV